MWQGEWARATLECILILCLFPLFSFLLFTSFGVIWGEGGWHGSLWVVAGDTGRGQNLKSAKLP